MAEGTLFRFEKSGDRYAPPAYSVGACSVKEQPMWYRIAVRDTGDGTDGCCLALCSRNRENAHTWELWLDPEGRWESRLFAGGGGASCMEDDMEIDSAIEEAVRLRNGGLGK